jgi:hypothetical protein
MEFWSGNCSPLTIWAATTGRPPPNFPAARARPPRNRDPSVSAAWRAPSSPEMGIGANQRLPRFQNARMQPRGQTNLDSWKQESCRHRGRGRGSAAAPGHYFSCSSGHPPTPLFRVTYLHIPSELIVRSKNVFRQLELRRFHLVPGHRQTWNCPASELHCLTLLILRLLPIWANNILFDLTSSFVPSPGRLCNRNRNTATTTAASDQAISVDPPSQYSSKQHAVCRVPPPPRTTFVLRPYAHPLTTSRLAIVLDDPLRLLLCL